MKITGIDLAKTNFYLFSINAYGKPTGKIKLSRRNLLSWPVQQPSMTIAMEARGALHHWQGRYKSSVIKRFSSITKKIRYGG
ncbi:hypothetical protein ACU62C_22855 [Klebsiella aerogenes]